MAGLNQSSGFGTRAFAGSALALLLSVSTSIQAAEMDVYGFVMGSMSARTSSSPLQSGEENNFLLSETRSRLEMMVESDSAETALTSKLDFVADGVSKTTDIVVRELYGEYRSDQYELRVGRQMLTWGVADRLFINDVFPKNWSAFFSGQPLEYMKMGSDMVKSSIFGDSWDLEIVLIPVAQFDKTPGAERFVVYQPAGMTGVSQPGASLNNAETALRFHTALGSTGLTLYAFQGFWHQPDKGMSGSEVIYPRLNSYGFTVQDSLLGGIVSVEGGLYQSTDDDAGNNPMIANSQSRYLLGYERELVADITVGVQFYGEIMADYADYHGAAQAAYVAGIGPVPTPEHRRITTLNVRALWLNQTLTTSLFIMKVGDGGRMINPDIHYTVSDEFSLNGGLHAFSGGPDSSMLGMMKEDDNVYLNATWSF